MLLHWLREAVDGPGKTPETVLPPTVFAIVQSVSVLYGEDLPTTSILATVMIFSPTSVFQEPNAVSAVVQVQYRREKKRRQLVGTWDSSKTQSDSTCSRQADGEEIS
ncbi:Uncharacterized protein Adt_09784 [Abeliophyllum distichum]|uniref:Uncharacterized protein n=1 Tax=Abeliophyllum distichum TaxID=126358 RepID=A0ABD1UI53_9LAMI